MTCASLSMTRAIVHHGNEHYTYITTYSTNTSHMYTRIVLIITYIYI